MLKFFLIVFIYGLVFGSSELLVMLIVISGVFMLSVMMNSVVLLNMVLLVWLM